MASRSSATASCSSDVAPDRPLVGVPNFSEGRSERVIEALQATLGGHCTVLNVHADPQHNRSVFTLAARVEGLAAGMLAGAEHAMDLIDMRAHQGAHPHIGALDVCPVVWVDEADRDRAADLARGVAAGIADLGIPVFLYGELASSVERRERSFFRRGGPAELARRMESGELEPDLGPSAPHPSAGATLVTARQPLVAFNVELDTPNPEIARAVAAAIREDGGGLPGIRALGMPREGERTQVSVNVHDPVGVPLARLVDEIGRRAAEQGARLVEAELVGLAPEAALTGYPEEPPIRGFDAGEHVLERALERVPG
jgi:glutamate formiminotransferase/glutamate formiminotransferase/formiminotetrahydrofolate cyclodeaminase